MAVINNGLNFHNYVLIKSSVILILNDEPQCPLDIIMSILLLPTRFIIKKLSGYNLRYFLFPALVRLRFYS